MIYRLYVDSTVRPKCWYIVGFDPRVELEPQPDEGMQELAVARTVDDLMHQLATFMELERGVSDG